MPSVPKADSADPARSAVSSLLRVLTTNKFPGVEKPIPFIRANLIAESYQSQLPKKKEKLLFVMVTAELGRVDESS